MGHDTRNERTIADARQMHRELREAIADAKTARREFHDTIEAMRSEMVKYTQGLARELVDELLRQEFKGLEGELQRVVTDIEQMVAERVTGLFRQYMQQEIDDAPSLDAMFEARRTLARWQKAYGALPVGHTPTSFAMEIDLTPTTEPYPIDQQKGTDQP